MYKVVGPCVRFSQHGPLPLARCRWPAAAGPLPLAHCRWRCQRRDTSRFALGRAALLRSVDDFHILSHSFLPGSLPPFLTATQWRRREPFALAWQIFPHYGLFFVLPCHSAGQPSAAVLTGSAGRNSRSFFFASFKNDSAIAPLGPAAGTSCCRAAIKAVRTHW